MTAVTHGLLAEPDLTQPPRAILAKAPAALRTFFRIVSAWDLEPREAIVLLGQPADSTYYRWRSGESVGGVTLDTMERLSHLFGIYAGLHRIFLEGPRADQWLRRPNTAPPFAGRAPLELLLRGRVADLLHVRRFIEHVTEGGL